MNSCRLIGRIVKTCGLLSNPVFYALETWKCEQDELVDKIYEIIIIKIDIKYGDEGVTQTSFLRHMSIKINCRTPVFK